jgi:hypothetical protein
MQTHEHEHHRHHDMQQGTTKLAIRATLHCLTGCAIGEVAGLVIGTAIGLSNAANIALAIILSFIFGYSLSLLPVVRAGVTFKKALLLVLIADTLSIATMELVDNTVMAAVPNAMNAGLTDTLYWTTMAISLVAAFVAAVPVNRWLLQRGRGHAVTHQYHH